MTDIRSMSLDIPGLLTWHVFDVFGVDDPLGMTRTFPVPDRDNVVVPVAQHEFIPVPEPGTIVFFVTACGGMFGDRLWQRVQRAGPRRDERRRMRAGSVR